MCIKEIHTYQNTQFISTYQIEQDLKQIKILENAETIFYYILLVAGYFIIVSKCQQSPCAGIQTNLGEIAGVELTTVLGEPNTQFCGYRGIRYEQPPIGNLRFKVNYSDSEKNGFVFNLLIVKFDRRQWNRVHGMVFTMHPIMEALA